jgi:DNA-binding beta-propeller fold protein YncE
MPVMKLVVAVLTCTLFGTLQPAGAEEKWSVVKTLQVGREGGWDYLTIDSNRHRLYVPRTTHTMVIDTESGKVLADMPGQKNAHGVALAPRAGRGFISDGGGDGAIVVFDLKTNRILGSIAAMADVDGIIFDDHANRVHVVSGRGKALFSFDPGIELQNAKLPPPVALRGEPEFLAVDGTGRLFVNLMDTHEVAVVDLKTRTVVAHWKVSPGGLPVGMAIDRAGGRLFIGCRGPHHLVVMNTRTGKVTSSVPIGESVDAVHFDQGQAFASTSGAQLFVADEGPDGHFRAGQTVKTGEGARTMALDPISHRIYLPSAEYETNAQGKQAQKPGTFRILVVARSKP